MHDVITISVQKKTYLPTRECTLTVTGLSLNFEKKRDLTTSEYCNVVYVDLIGPRVYCLTAMHLIALAFVILFSFFFQNKIQYKRSG